MGRVVALSSLHIPNVLEAVRDIEAVREVAGDCPICSCVHAPERHVEGNRPPVGPTCMRNGVQPASTTACIYGAAVIAYREENSILFKHFDRHCTANQQTPSDRPVLQ